MVDRFVLGLRGKNIITIYSTVLSLIAETDLVDQSFIRFDRLSSFKDSVWEAQQYKIKRLI